MEISPRKLMIVAQQLCSGQSFLRLYFAIDEAFCASRR